MNELDVDRAIETIVRGLLNGSHSIWTFGLTLVFRDNQTDEQWVVAQEIHDQLFLRGHLGPPMGGRVH